ncbi:MAG: hypothetical protein AAGC83_05220 [Pseudomonadota bacterium]
MTWSLARIMAPVFVLVFLVQAALAQDGTMGRLAEFLPGSQQDPPWVFVNEASGFTMTNQDDPNAVKYFYILPQGGTEGARTIETSVTLSPGSAGAGGLIFGFNPDARTYFAFAVAADRSLTLYRRDQNGFGSIADFGQVAQSSAPNVLTIVERPDKSELSINGEYLGAVEGISGGGTGILALGIVEAQFAGFADGPAQESAAPIELTPSEGVATAAASTGTPPDAPLRLVPIEIVDPAAPFGSSVAYDAMIPHDWVTEGGIIWNPPNGCHRGPRLAWGAETADGSYGLGLLPPISWSANNYGGANTGCLSSDLTDAEAVMRAYFDLTPEAQARLIEISRPPELEPVIQQLSAQNVPLPSGQSWMDGVLVRAEVVEDGRQSDAYILALTLHWEISQNNGLVQGGPSISRGGNLVLGLVVATPPGRLEDGHPAFAAIMGNLRPRPQWNQNVANWWANQARATSGGSGAAPLSTPSSDTGSVTDMMFESWQRREGVRDAGQARSISGIWETQNFQTSTGGTVSLSQNYRNTWELGDGSLVQTDDDNFNPMETFNEFGTQLEAVE